MRPDDHDLDQEIRGHLALSVKERIERGEDPEAARLAALREFGYVPAIRDSMRRVWFSRWPDAVAALGRDMRIGLRSLLRTKGLAATVVVTLARHRRQCRDIQRGPWRANGITWFMWLPTLVFELTLAVWFIVKGVGTPARRLAA
jgi:hypothetical protein